MLERDEKLESLVTTSPVSHADFEALLALRIAAMRPSLERVGRFDPARARERLQKSFAPEHTWWIVVAEERVGFYTVRPTDKGLALDHFYVHPEHQGRGIGSVMLQRLLAEANAQGRAVVLNALRGSESNRFYQRHGFVQTAEDEWDIYYAYVPRHSG